MVAQGIEQCRGAVGFVHDESHARCLRAQFPIGVRREEDGMADQTPLRELFRQSHPVAVFQIDVEDTDVEAMVELASIATARHSLDGQASVTQNAGHGASNDGIVFHVKNRGAVGWLEVHGALLSARGRGDKDHFS